MQWWGNLLSYGKENICIHPLTFHQNNFLQILMHSGIGPAAELTKHSIPVIVDLPGVGAHLQDHPLVPTRYRAKANCESISFLASRTLGEKAKALMAKVQYLLYGTGPLTCNVSSLRSGCILAYTGLVLSFSWAKLLHSFGRMIRSSSPSRKAMVLSRTQHQALAPRTLRYSQRLLLGRIMDSGVFHLDSCSALRSIYCGGSSQLICRRLRRCSRFHASSPTSYGTITLRSADPFDDPIIDPKSVVILSLINCNRDKYFAKGTSPLNTTLTFLSVASSSSLK